MKQYKNNLFPLRKKKRLKKLYSKESGVLKRTPQIKLYTIILSITLLLIACGGTICTDEKKKVLLNYNPTFKTVDVSGLPTYKAGDYWVKKIIVETNGFLVVTEQKTAGYKQVPCEEESKKGQLCQKYNQSSHYNMQSYIEGVGYKYWGKIPKKEWESISSLEDEPSRKPDVYKKNCRFSLFGPLLDILMAAMRA